MHGEPQLARSRFFELAKMKSELGAGSSPAAGELGACAGESAEQGQAS